MPNNIINIIANAATSAGADPTLMVATALQESGLDPSQVGDHGTSYGLFQDHVGGAGGSTHASARRYLNPEASSQHAAQRFKGMHTAEDAFRTQRPADHAGYVRGINANIAKAKRLLAGVDVSGGAVGGDPLAHVASKDDRLGVLKAQWMKNYLGYNNDPNMSALIDQKFAPTGDITTPAPADPGNATIPTRSLQGSSFKDLERQFHLKRSSGDHEQPGAHVQGSWHYKHDQNGSARAYDYGNVPNKPGILMSAIQALLANPGDVKEAFYDPAGKYIKNGKVYNGAIGGHGDHLHVAY